MRWTSKMQEHTVFHKMTWPVPSHCFCVAFTILKKAIKNNMNEKLTFSFQYGCIHAPKTCKSNQHGCGQIRGIDVKVTQRGEGFERGSLVRTNLHYKEIKKAFRCCMIKPRGLLPDSADYDIGAGFGWYFVVLTGTHAYGFLSESSSWTRRKRKGEKKSYHSIIPVPFRIPQLIPSHAFAS